MVYCTWAGWCLTNNLECCLYYWDITGSTLKYNIPIIVQYGQYPSILVILSCGGLKHASLDESRDYALVKSYLALSSGVPQGFVIGPLSDSWTTCQVHSGHWRCCLRIMLVGTQKISLHLSPITARGWSKKWNCRSTLVSASTSQFGERHPRTCLSSSMGLAPPPLCQRPKGLKGLWRLPLCPEER